MPFSGGELVARCLEPVLAFCLEPVAFGLAPALRFEVLPALRADPAAVFCVVPLAFRADPAAFWVFGEAAISVLLPAAAARRGFPFPAVSGKVSELLPGCLQRTLCLVLGAALLHAPDKARQAFLLLGDVEPVDGFGEPEIGIDACDDDARVNGQQLD